jgi:hypothetical protein
MTEDSRCLLSMIHVHRKDTVGIPEAVLLSGIRVTIGKSILHSVTIVNSDHAAEASML